MVGSDLSNDLSTNDKRCLQYTKRSNEDEVTSNPPIAASIYSPRSFAPLITVSSHLFDWVLVRGNRRAIVRIVSSASPSGRFSLDCDQRWAQTKVKAVTSQPEIWEHKLADTTVLVLACSKANDPLNY